MSQPHPAYTNALIHETSPYLLQHAHNPVDWQPWSAETLRRAREEDKPILLSIGYSACHWCHVMAHESFEDPQTAELMNRLYVNVKVDREERPDLDKIYQTAHYLLARRNGGWPLTLFLMPDDQTPFFGGTYFPRQERHGLPSFQQVLVRVAEFFAEHRDELARQNESLRQALASEHLVSGGDGAVLGAQPLDAAREALGRDFDRRHGGFGRAPKFPRPTSVERLLRHYALSLAGGEGDKGALSMADETLRAMAKGGINDQVGGGFCRYSVDDQWMIPHFEKMLYDNGPLLDLYTRAWQLTREPLFERTARRTAQWVMREMQSIEGGYYATLDADSEGEEGRFYVWTPQEVAELLDAEQYRVWAMHVGLDRAANFEGRWHPHVFQDEAALTSAAGLPLERVQALLDGARERLFAAREGRVRPGRDEKVLTGWNGLTIAAMATAGRVFGEPRYIESAERASDFVRDRLWDGERLLAGYKDGRAHLAAYLDDHVFLVAGLLSLLEARWRAADLDLAVRLADRVLARFEDRERGGFFFTADDHEALIHRPKPLADDALPSGNGIAVQVLLRLGTLLGEPRYLAAAENALKNAWPVLEQMPHAHEALLAGLEEQLHPVQVVVLRGTPRALEAWGGRLARGYAPRRLVLPIASDAADLPPALAGKAPQGEVTAYVCSGQTCSPPLTTEDALAALVGQNDV